MSSRVSSTWSGHGLPRPPVRVLVVPAPQRRWAHSSHQRRLLKAQSPVSAAAKTGTASGGRQGDEVQLHTARGGNEAGGAERDRSEGPTRSQCSYPLIPLLTWLGRELWRRESPSPAHPPPHRAPTTWQAPGGQELKGDGQVGATVTVNGEGLGQVAAEKGREAEGAGGRGFSPARCPGFLV